MRMATLEEKEEAREELELAETGEDELFEKGFAHIDRRMGGMPTLEAFDYQLLRFGLQVVIYHNARDSYLLWRVEQITKG